MKWTEEQHKDYLKKMVANPTINARKGKRNKYGAVKTTIDGIKFDSKKEAKRYELLSSLARSGEIFRLELQPSYKIKIGGEEVKYPSGRTITYIADFRYKNRSGDMVVEDVKGLETAVFKIKRALVEHIYNIKIEVK